MTELNKNWLIKKLQEFGKNNLIFSNEAQFQFKLAWEIQKEFNDYNVFLEHLSVTEIEKINEKEYYKKNYTDIVIETNNKTYIAIELKYKTKKIDGLIDENNNGIALSNQWATDLGRFDYIWDINRLEFLTNAKNKFKEKTDKETDLRKEANSYRNDEKPLQSRKYIINNKFTDHPTSAFAIILTNEDSYWTFSKNENVTDNNGIKLKSCRKNSQYKKFCIGQGDEINGKCDWLKDESENENPKYKTSVIDTWRGRPIELLNTYTFNWENYEDSNNYFKFCITEVTEKM